WSFLFFFQAEDGIRDFHVTGVQTCALPISDQDGGDVVHAAVAVGGSGEFAGEAVEREVVPREDRGELSVVHHPGEAVGAEEDEEIGRASCRERVWIGGEAGAAEESPRGARA